MGKSSRASLALFALLSSLTLAGAAPADAASAKLLRYHGREIGVPAGWPVYDLARHPTTCVRLDRAAVYVGVPGAGQRCPAHVVGRSRAILIEPRGARAVVLHGVRAGAPTGGGTLPGQGSGGGARAPASSVVGATYSGLGFDPCSAPSVTQMAAWLASPYRAVGIYIGGTNMGCAQPNLTAGWVSQESAAGWHLIPTYVGLQAPANSCGCAGISSRAATAQGVSAANDAVARAAALGLGRGNPIYTDMEYYPRSGSNSSAVLAYLSGWTAQLHASGYLSGVYGNSDSVIADLLTREGTGYPEPDDIWFAEWNGVASVSSSYIPSGFWVGHRLHQYDGGHNATYGGVTINIDGDAVDGATAAAGSATLHKVPFADGTFVQVAGKQAVYRIAGGAPLVVKDWTGFGGPQPYQVITAQQLAALNKVPANGTFLKSTWGAPYAFTTLFRVAGGAALPIMNLGLFSGTQSAVPIDQWDIVHPHNPQAHLAARPADGTVVEGLPSRTYWVFQGGLRRIVPATASATQVDDAALNAFATVPCLVPSLRGLTLRQARAVLQAADCTLGKVHRLTRPAPHGFLHVLTQFPAANRSRPALKPVNVTLG